MMWKWLSLTRSQSPPWALSRLARLDNLPKPFSRSTWRSLSPQGRRALATSATSSVLNSISQPIETRGTIFAVSTGLGRSPLAVIRVSGPRAFQALKELTLGDKIPAARLATLRNLHDPRSKELLDRGLVLTFQSPASFTGEDIVELHVHGGNAIVSGILQDSGHHLALSKVDGLAPAEPGEFSKRAFLNGKMDLTQVEGIHDLINAETEWQRRQALRQVQGELTTTYENWRRDLIRAMAHTEARIDFGEEQLEDESMDEIVKEVRSLKVSIERYLNDGHRGEIVRDGLHVTIMGAPNAGKSSLMNALAQRNVVIVSPQAGTTRDVVEVSINLGGFQVILSDTAGLREDPSDQIEQEGIQRATERIRSADVKLLVVDMEDLKNPALSQKLRDAVEKHLDERTFLLVNKLDLDPSFSLKEPLNIFSKPVRTIGISCVTKEGLNGLTDALIEWISKEFREEHTEGLRVTQARHRILLQETIENLDRFIANAEGNQVVFAAEDLRHAATSLGRITGRVDMEEILDVLFKDFCIGK